MLNAKIIGQEEAVSAISAAIRRSRVQISPRRRPASFIFVGPTGVGKTELVKVLSQELFDTPETLKRSAAARIRCCSSMRSKRRIRT